MASCCMPGQSSMALFTCTAKLDPEAHGARCAWAMAVHHADISRQRNSGYRPSRVNIMAQGLSTPDPSFSSTHLSIRRGRITTTHTIKLAWWCRATLHLSLRWGCTLGLWGRHQHWHAKGACVTPNKKESEKRPIVISYYGTLLGS